MALRVILLLLELRVALATLKCNDSNLCNGQNYTGQLALFEGYGSGNNTNIVGTKSDSGYPNISALGANAGMYSNLTATYFEFETFGGFNSIIRGERILFNGFYAGAHSDTSRTFDSNLEGPAQSDDYWQVDCRGMYGLAFSKVWGHRYINAHGGYCLVNATIDSVDIKGNIMDVIFGGYKSGMGTDITCRDGHQCYVQCWAHSCQDMTCNGNGCNVTYLYQSSVLPQFEEIDYLSLYTQLDAKCNNTNSGQESDLYCCRGQESCYHYAFRVREDYDIFASGESSLGSASPTEPAKNVYCFGGSCTKTEATTQNIYCLGGSSCQNANIAMTGQNNTVICAGIGSCLMDLKSSVKSSGIRTGSTMTVVALATNAFGHFGDHITECQTLDTCFFYFLAPQIATNDYMLDIACDGTCTIYCVDPTACPLCSGNCNNYTTAVPTAAPTIAPSQSPTLFPTDSTNHPTVDPTSFPTDSTGHPTVDPTIVPTVDPTSFPTASTKHPSVDPTIVPTSLPTQAPSIAPTFLPTLSPSLFPTGYPSNAPSAKPTVSPSHAPTYPPTAAPSFSPSAFPSNAPSFIPSAAPTLNPSQPPTDSTLNPSVDPTVSPSQNPTKPPTNAPSSAPSNYPSLNPSKNPTISPSPSPTFSPSNSPTEASNDISGAVEETTNDTGSAVLMSVSGLMLFLFVTLCVGGICYLKKRKRIQKETEEAIRVAMRVEMDGDVPKETLNEADGKAKTMETNHAATECDFDVVVGGGADEHKPDGSKNTVLSHGATGSDAFDMIMSQMGDAE